MNAVATAPTGEWVIAKRRGNRVRYRHTGTLAWGGWEKLTPDHPEYRHPVVSATDVSGGMPAVPHVDEPAPEMKYAEMSRDELRNFFLPNSFYSHFTSPSRRRGGSARSHSRPFSGSSRGCS